MKYYFRQLWKVPMFAVFVAMSVFFGLGALGQTAEIDQFAVVTALGIDLAEDDPINKYEVSLMTFVPVAEQNFTERYKIITAKGRNVSEAIDFAGLNIGKQVGLSHLKIIVLSQELIHEDLFKFLDYLTRNVQLSLSTKVVTSHDNSAKEFLATAQTLDTESAIKVSELVTFNSDYIYSTDSSLETFFKGTFGPTKVGMMACLTSQNGQEDALESAAGEASGSKGGGQSGHSVGGQEDNLGVMQCHVDVFKDGKLIAGLDGREIKRVNLVKGDYTTGSIQVTNLTDDVFDDATVTFEIFGKRQKYQVVYENGIPVLTIDLNLVLRLSEVENKGGMVKENVEFFVISDEAIKAVEQKIKLNMSEGLEFMRDNQVDIADFYTFLHNNNKKAFHKFLDSLEDKDNYLSHMVFKLAVKVNAK